MNKAIYMDYAAATPMDDRVLEAMKPFFSEQFYNPSSVYLASRAVKDELAEARSQVAHWLGARPSEVTFTAGATEANNLAISGVLRGPAGSVLYSAIEHEAVIEPAQKFRHSAIDVDERGMVNLDDLAEKITPKTSLVSIMYANNEVGSVQHLSEITSIIKTERERRRENKEERAILLHTDASQAPNYLDLHVDKLGVDLMTLNAGKIYGPKQVGALYVRAGIHVMPIVEGGGQEHGLRSGTENIAGAVGMGKALAIAQKMRRDETHRIQGLSAQLRNGIAEVFADAIFLGHKKHRLPNITSVMIPGVDGERVVMMLDEKGVQIATGSACSALRDESSHVVQALGYTPEEAMSTLRFSLGRQSTDEDVAHVLHILPNVIAEARNL